MKNASALFLSFPALTLLLRAVQPPEEPPPEELGAWRGKISGSLSVPFQNNNNNSADSTQQFWHPFQDTVLPNGSKTCTK